MSESVDAVVVGGGQAGIALSHYLQQRNVDHVVLERDQAFSSWRNRWDGFTTNTPNWMNTLPVLSGGGYPSDDPRAFATREELVDYFDQCLRAVDPPMRTGQEVIRIRSRAGGSWEVETTDGSYETHSVAVCTGAMATPNIPSEAAAIPDRVPQLHSSEYRSPDQIETSSALVVGAASSGVQICRLVAESGRVRGLHMAVSKVLVLPDRVFGVQTHRLLHAFRLFDVRTRSPIGRLMYSGLETRGDPIMRPTPRDLSRSHGVVLHGRFESVRGPSLHFADGTTLATDDLTIIWCTGFRSDYAFIETAQGSAFDETGHPVHTRGVVDAAPGLFFVGLRLQHTIASHDIYGVAKDAEFVAAAIAQRLGTNRPIHGEASEGA